MSDFLYQVLALIIAVIVVHSIWVTVVLPKAWALLDETAARQARGEKAEHPRSIYIILKDYEQESTVILSLWALAIMGLKAKRLKDERALLKKGSLLEVTPGISILPEDTRKYARSLQALPESTRQYLLPRVLVTALQRFGSTRNVQDVAGAVGDVCQAESDRLDSEMAMIRYIIWAIPSIGFLGTVRGIGDALSYVQAAVQGNVIGVTISLGVAFNSTLVALMLSLFIMFLLHQLQLVQERLVLDTRNYCDLNLLQHLQVR